MKYQHLKIVLYLFLFISLVSTSLAQVTLDSVAVKCNYLYTFQEDSTNTASKKSEMTVLLIGKHISRFNTLNMIKADSVRAMIRKERDTRGRDYAAGLISSIPKTKFHFIIYKNHPVQKYTVSDKIFKDTYIYQEEIPEFNWSIKPDKKTVAGYPCQKAITSFAGRTYEAWFTTDIPISDGPYKFSGLPGLIVAIEDTQHFFSFQLTSLTKPTTQEPIAITTEKTISTTRKEFDKGTQHLKNNFFDVTENQGIKFDRRNTSLQQMLEKEKKSLNNFIEKN